MSTSHQSQRVVVYIIDRKRIIHRVLIKLRLVLVWVYYWQLLVSGSSGSSA